MHEYHLLPAFIGAEKGKVAFNLYLNRQDSSIYEPDPRYRDAFRGSGFEVEKVVEVESRILSEVVEDEGIPPVDLLKLDTQGSELEILRSSRSLLESIPLVEIEVEFTRMYKGQALFHEVASYMEEMGFELLYLNRVLGQRAQAYQGYARGQIIFADALYGRREDLLGHFPIPRLVKYVLLLINYGHLDAAMHVCRLYPETMKVLPELSGYFENPHSRKLSYRVGRRLGPMIGPRIDKLIALLLHLRTHNYRIWDSDRSWPTR